MAEVLYPLFFCFGAAGYGFVTDCKGIPRFGLENGLDCLSRCTLREIRKRNADKV